MAAETPSSALFTLAPRPTCDQVLNACDQALSDARSDLSVKSLVIDKMTVQTKMLSDSLAQAQAQDQAFYHNPFVMGSIGLVAGVIGGIWAAKK